MGFEVAAMVVVDGLNHQPQLSRPHWDGVLDGTHYTQKVMGYFRLLLSKINSGPNHNSGLPNFNSCVWLIIFSQRNSLLLFSKPIQPNNLALVHLLGHGSKMKGIRPPLNLPIFWKCSMPCHLMILLKTVM